MTDKRPCEKNSKMQGGFCAFCKKLYNNLQKCENLLTGYLVLQYAINERQLA